MRTTAKIALATIGFAAVHSALATRNAKSLAGGLAGERRRDGAYRIFYVGPGCKNINPDAGKERAPEHRISCGSSNRAALSRSSLPQRM